MPIFLFQVRLPGPGRAALLGQSAFQILAIYNALQPVPLFAVNLDKRYGKGFDRPSRLHVVAQYVEYCRAERRAIPPMNSNCIKCEWGPVNEDRAPDVDISLFTSSLSVRGAVCEQGHFVSRSWGVGYLGLMDALQPECTTPVDGRREHIGLAYTRAALTLSAECCCGLRSK